MFDNTFILEYCHASVETKAEEWFHSFCSMDINTSHKFNKLCQHMMTFIFTQFYLSSSHHRNNKESSFWYNIFNYITINKTYLIDLVKEYQLNDKFRNHTALYILFEHLVELFNDWLKMMMEDISIRMNKDVTDNNIDEHTFVDKCKEVNGFFGFAVSSMHKKYLEKLHDSNLLE